MPTFPCHFHGKIDHIDWFRSKSKFSINPKISVILKIDIPLRSVNMGRNENPWRSGIRVGVLDKTTIKFFKNIDFKHFSTYLWTFKSGLICGCPQICRKMFKIYIFEIFYSCFVRNLNADSRPRGISISTHIDRSQGNVNFQNSDFFHFSEKSSQTSLYDI